MLLDRDAPGDWERARGLIAAGRAEAEQLGMARELVIPARLTPGTASRYAGRRADSRATPRTIR